MSSSEDSNYKFLAGKSSKSDIDFELDDILWAFPHFNVSACMLGGGSSEAENEESKNVEQQKREGRVKIGSKN